MNDLKYWLAISQINQIGPIKFNRLVNYFSDMSRAWSAGYLDLKRVGLDDAVINEFLTQRNHINPETELEKVIGAEINVITIKDKNYPPLLKEIYNPPALLYLKGEFKKEDQFSLAVVGTRKPTAYGRQVTEEITARIAQNKITIVSGLALGIDAIAHQACLGAAGRTIAVLGSGVDLIYPKSNQALADRILTSGGAIISEFPLGTEPFKQNFPLRNRIISGLSLGTLVTEAPITSGALITAKYALDQNREVFAVPGSIYNPNSEGPNHLIKMGAKSVQTYADILETLNLEQIANFTQNLQIIPETEEEKILLPFLSKEPVHIDLLIKKSKLNTSIVNACLMVMEMKGKVKNIGGMNYILSR